MEDFIQFVLRHWVLACSFSTLLVMIIAFELKANLSGVLRVSPQEAIQLLNHQNAVVIDTRDSTPFQNGHILGSKNIPANKIKENVQKLEPYKTKPIILVCENGQQSTQIANWLLKQGLDNLRCIRGGLMGWRQMSLPLSKE